MKEKSYRSKAERPIKVLQVITRLIPGGAAYIALNLSRGLKERGFHVCLAGALEPEMTEEIRETGASFYPIPELRREINPLSDLKAFIKLYNLISKNNYQIVHTHTSKAGILGRLAARLAQTPVIIHTPHGSIFHPTFFSLPSRWFFALIERITAYWADNIIAICQSEVSDYLRHRIAPKEKYFVIQGIFDPDRFRQAQVNIKEKKQKLGLPEDSFVIGMIARLSPEKGHCSALEAFQKVHKEIPNAFLLIVGEGEMKEAVRQRATKMGLEDRVIMTGYRRDIPEITCILDVSLNPSLWDCSPRSILEAMACRVPVIATSVGGIPETVTHGETGLLVPPGDAEAIAHCILRMRKDEELVKRITTSAAEKVLELYNPSQTIEKTIQLYLGLLAKKGFTVETGQTNAC